MSTVRIAEASSWKSGTPDNAASKRRVDEIVAVGGERGHGGMLAEEVRLDGPQKGGIAKRVAVERLERGKSRIRRRPPVLLRPPVCLDQSRGAVGRGALDERDLGGGAVEGDKGGIVVALDLQGAFPVPALLQEHALEHARLLVRGDAARRQESRHRDGERAVEDASADVRRRAPSAR